MFVAQTVRPPPLVLIVDTHEDTRDMLVCLLHQLHGLSVREASTASDALRIVAQSAPDIVVTEMALPSVDGYELCRRLRQHATIEGTPIIALTSLVSPRQVAKAYEAGCDVVLSKPCAPATLLDTISRLLPSTRASANRRTADRITCPLAP